MLHRRCDGCRAVFGVISQDVYPSSLCHAAAALRSALTLCADKHVVKETRHAQTWRALLSGVGGAHLDVDSGKWVVLPLVEMFDGMSRVLLASAQGSDQMLVAGTLLESQFRSLLGHGCGHG